MPVSTTWVERNQPSTTWDKKRLGGAYLQNSLGEYITTNNGERIIVIVPGGEIEISTWVGRITPSAPIWSSNL